MMKDFKQLKVWEKSHKLSLDTYKATRVFPREELYGLTSQIRRAVVSIETNIAEGCGRTGDPELGRFLRISMGSASELECHLLLAHDLGFLARIDYDRLARSVSDVKRMLTSFLKKLTAES
jgi:four helix bundle protein